MRLHKHFAATTLIVYWFALLAGLSIYTYTRPNDFDVMGLWMGVIIGTILGNTLGVRDVRIWLAIVIIAGISILCAPFTPPKQSGLLFWMAFIPATLCGYAALSERGGLIAFWFPSVMWMLTILDHGHGALKVDGASAGLLGGMACVFLAFLYAREQRRVSMWRTISPTALAPETAPKILRDIPRLRVGVAGWSLIVSSAAFALTAWVAPKLWHVEELVPELWTSRAPGSGGDGHGGLGLPCCHAPDEFETKRERVKEYMDLGRGHEAETEEIDQGECVVCTPDGRPIDPRGYGYAEGDHPTLPDCSADDPWCMRGYGTGYSNGYSYGYGTGGGGYSNGYGTGGGNGTGGYVGNGWDRQLTPEEQRLQREEERRAEEEQRQLRLERERQEREDWERDRPERERQEREQRRLDREERERQRKWDREHRKEREQEERERKERERQQRELQRQEEREARARMEADRKEREQQAREQQERERQAQKERERQEAASPPPQVAAAPEPPPPPAPVVEPPQPPPPPATHEPAPPTQALATSTTARRASPAGGHDIPALSWIAIVIAAGLGFQLLVIGLRPIRRLVTLRHLRKPFWGETVDQRVSNWWHLVLVGLRDAGWRTSSGEGPRDLAHRLDIPGVERAATILERARHGVGIDTTDLSDMEDAAETAYRSSRERASTFQRFLGWFRRPLV